MNTFFSWIPSFVQPAAAWLFALLIPIVVVYFLKLRRDRVEISSLALWRQVLNDQRVNSPFQRFKRNLLLLLQLLLLCLLALAAMQPYLPGDVRDLQYLPVLVDCSASMGAKDASGKTRLELAQEEIEEVIDGLLPNQQLTLISVGSTARRLTEFTDNKPVLKTALQSLRVEDVPSRLEDGLRLTQALARTHPVERIRLYSDGNLPVRLHPGTGQSLAVVDVDLPFQLDFFQIPTVPENMGITALNARRSSLEEWDVFLRVGGTTGRSSEGTVTLTADGEAVGTESVVIGPGESQRLVFRVAADSARFLEATFKPTGADALAADNRAWLTLPAGRPLDIYCAETLPTFGHALRALEGVNVLTAEEAAQRAAFDLVVSDAAEDLAREAPLGLMVGVIPEDLQGLVEIRQEPTDLVDWSRGASLLQHVQLKDVLISETPAKAEEVTDSDIEERGYEILAHGGAGPLLVRKREGRKTTYFFLFKLEQSTLPYRVGFPVLVTNVVTEALQRASLGDVKAVSTGTLPPLQLTAEQTYRITSPDGRHEERVSDHQGRLAGIGATQTGQYEIRSGGNLLENIGVSLLNAEETSLSSVDRIHFNEVSVEARESRLREDQPLWGELALLAFGLLLLEWWYFQKRPGGIPG